MRRPLEVPPPTRWYLPRSDGSGHEIMVLATADFVALPLPVGCDVPVGALNHTGVMSKRNELLMELLLRSRATGPRTLRYFLLTYPEVAAAGGGVEITYLPPLLITALA